ncbi:hypothetical protein J6590_022280 [Homalodisca vitripennis]|nr:hypothetical protein J6590_022280 [Homalodisca vitripennis]
MCVCGVAERGRQRGGGHVIRSSVSDCPAPVHHNSRHLKDKELTVTRRDEMRQVSVPHE